MPESLRLAAAAHRAAAEFTFRERFKIPEDGSALVVDQKEVSAAYHAVPSTSGGMFVDECTRGDERRRSLGLLPPILHELYELVRADERFVYITLCVKNRPGKGDEGLLVGQATNDKHYVIAAWDVNGIDRWQLPPASAPLS